MEVGEINCENDDDCCDTAWCDLIQGANPKCKRLAGGGGGGNAVSVGDASGKQLTLTSTNGKTINGLYVIVVIVVIVLLIGLSMIGYICYQRKSKSKIEIVPEIEVSVCGGTNADEKNKQTNIE
jgi:hypothetical protein